MGAIVVREFLSVLRLRRAAWLLFAVAACSCLFVLLQWPSDALVDLSGNQTRRTFQVYSYGMLAVVLLVSPIFAATSIVREKQSGTLALLLNAPLHPVRLYLGKWIGSVGFVVMVLLASLPAASALTAMGGVSLAAELVPLYVVLVLAAVQCVCLALWISSCSNSTDAALRYTYAAVLGVTVLSVAPHLFLQGRSSLTAHLAAHVRCISPIPAVLELLGHGDVVGLGFRTTVLARPSYPYWALGLIAFCSAATVARLNYRLFDRPRPKGVMTHERSRAGQWLRRLLFIVDPQRRTWLIPRWLNPIMVKEFRSRRFGRAWWLLRWVALSAIVALLLTCGSATATISRGVSVTGGILVGFQSALVLLLTPSLTAPLFSLERETGGWVLLQVTPVSVLRLLGGKLVSVLITLCLIVAATVPSYLVLVWINQDLWLQVRLVLVSLGWTMLFCVLLGATMSTYFRRTAPATVATYLVLLLLYAGTLLIWLARDAPFGHDLVESALRLNTLAAAWNIIGTPGFRAYRLVPDAWNITAAACAVLLVLLWARVRYLLRPV
ncbi:MAG: hypothetical protein KatS3mg109_1788 [Pirellulaceae bacterium]|nr:MAG: hypothetical protein KatS3mg109_1788 [Pirellulaceae bacterium]